MKRLVGVFLALITFMTAGCNAVPDINVNLPDGTVQKIDISSLAGNADVSGNAPGDDKTAEPTEKNGEVMVLFTSDIHCGVDKGFGYAGVAQIRKAMEDEGYTTILVDDGDAIQGEAIGSLSKGEAIVNIMNEVGYDVAIPGNHEFDYGMDQFMHLTGLADFPYICCNFRKEGKRVFDPYIIKEACGIKIAFVGVTTPESITKSTPEYFENEKGEFIYDFMQDNTGKALWEEVQKSVDSARDEGADVVYVMGHMGNVASSSPYTYADIIENTNGIDAFLDGHSHDTDQVVMKNKDGREVKRVCPGYKLNCIGYSRITKDQGVVETGSWSWPNNDSAVKLFEINNHVSEKVTEEQEKLKDKTDTVVAETEQELTIYYPEETDSSGNPIRMVRRSETNLGDLCADAFRIELGTDIGMVNGGGVRESIKKGDLTIGEIINVFPFSDSGCIIEATGQQILDFLEWGARSLPDENGAFVHVSGMTYEIDTSIPSGCKSSDDGMCEGCEGERRVRNVMVADEPLDPSKKYTVAGNEYMLRKNGDGQTAFNEAVLLENTGKSDNQVLYDYIVESLDGHVGKEYADPYGQGRITVLE